MTGDLPCYTKLSLSSMGIDELITLAQKRGVDTLAITDRDCLAGLVRAKMTGARKGVSIVPAVEISCRDKETNIYCEILCYLPDRPDRLEGLCHKNLLAKKSSSQKTVLAVAKRYPISPELIQRCATGSTAVYEHHIIHALFECGLTDRFYGDLHQELFGAGSESRVLYPVDYASPEEVIDAIHDAGGIAVLSHPGENVTSELLERLISLGLDGIEVFCPSNSEETMQRLINRCKGTDLLMTGGTEFKGMFSNQPLCVGDVEVPESNIKSLLNYKTKMKKRRAAAKKAAEGAE